MVNTPFGLYQRNIQPWGNFALFGVVFIKATTRRTKLELLKNAPIIKKLTGLKIAR